MTARVSRTEESLFGLAMIIVRGGDDLRRRDLTAGRGRNGRAHWVTEGQTVLIRTYGDDLLSLHRSKARMSAIGKPSMTPDVCITTW